MPVLKRIVVQDYRNIAFQELDFSPKINCISGNNGEGKTNLLDAIHYLSMTKSAFPVPDRFNRRWGTPAFVIAGTYAMEDGTVSRFSVKVSSESEKKLVRDDKPYTRLASHIGVLPVVMISPSDGALVTDSGDLRRRFSNAVLSQMDREYLSALQQYNRLLLQRNVLLKDRSSDLSLLEVIDGRMEVFAKVVQSGRKRLAEDLRPVISNYYSMISGGAEEVSLEYRPDLGEASLTEVFRESLEKDRAMGFTTSGVQRDDFAFTMDGYPVRQCGSQGQQKSFLVALKFAQYEVMRKRYGFAPTLLLDDVFDKLDMKRVANLISMVAGNGFGQIFITDSNKSRLRGVVDSITDDRTYFNTAGGVFTKE
ncbi:MAG: DNA replication and repair protein RecF [Bacteroidales bacterium]|nr:DNA replication and repair protein RecF [Bacteroidales bacterium]